MGISMTDCKIWLQWWDVWGLVFVEQELCNHAKKATQHLVYRYICIYIHTYIYIHIYICVVRFLVQIA